MRVCVVAPREAYLAQAGVRIRYQRIAPHLAAQGDLIEVKVIDDLLGPQEAEFDAYLFSKVYDARSYLVAHRLHRAGRLVGVDLFDDYFSQVADSRFTPQRRWLQTMARWSGFVLCSTRRMQEVAASCMPGVPSHVMNDPCEEMDARAIGRAVARKLADARRTGELQVAWFGNGDNPHFPVGLQDVHAFGPLLHGLRASGLAPRLRLLTNRRALTVDGLAALARLDVPWTIGEWSLAAEQELLTDALVAFIPVNAQPFSIAKSLNRAVSALSSGTQVLSAGYPLYAPLGSLVYRETQSLLDDVDSGCLRLRAESAGMLAERFGEWADPEAEAQGFAGFLEDVMRARRAPPSAALPASGPAMGIVNGSRSGTEVHRFVQRFKEISVGSPYSPDGPSYDVRFTGGTDGVPATLEIDEGIVPSVAPDLAQHLERGAARRKTVMKLDLHPHFPQHAAALERARATRASHLSRHALYGDAMGSAFEVLQSVFPGVEFVLSESEAPFTVQGPGGVPRRPSHAGGPR